VKPVVAVAFEIVTAAVLAFTVTVCDELLPTFTDPKLNEVVLTESVPVVLTSAPVPLKATVAVELEALLTSVRLPLTAPEVVGANFTENEALCPAARVSGRVSPLTVKPVVAFACEIVTAAVLAFTVTVCDELLPTFTDPKLNELELSESVPTAGAELVTVIFSAALYTAPVLSQAWTTM